MYRGLQMLQDRRNQLFPIIVDGVKNDDATGQTIGVPTHFDRVSDIIQYINHWQDQYLDMRRQKRHLHDLDENAFNEHLRIMREISSEAGEFLRVLRTIPHQTLEELEASDYEAVFRFVNAASDWEPFKRLRLNEKMSAQPAQSLQVTPPIVVTPPVAPAPVEEPVVVVETPPIAIEPVAIEQPIAPEPPVVLEQPVFEEPSAAEEPVAAENPAEEITKSLLLPMILKKNWPSSSPPTMRTMTPTMPLKKIMMYPVLPPALRLL